MKARLAVCLFALVLLPAVASPVAHARQDEPRPAPPDVSIWAAVAEGKMGAVQQHIAAGTDLNGILTARGVPGVGGSPLHIAGIAKQAAIAQALIDAGADVNLRAEDQFGGAPLHWAAFMGAPEVVAVLIGAGADVNAPDRLGNTPLDAAIGGLAKPDVKEGIVGQLKAGGARHRVEIEAADMPEAPLQPAGPIERSAPKLLEPADWPMYNYDVAGTRHNAAEKVLSRENVGKIVELWRFPAAESKSAIGVIHATPSVVDGEVYFGTATLPAFYKLSADGELLWSFEMSGARGAARRESARPEQLSPGDGVYSSALITEDSVYFGDARGVMYCLDRGTGQLVWRVDSHAADFPGAHETNLIMASPILAAGRVIFAGGAYEHSAPLNPSYACCRGRGFVVALDPADGAIAWKYDVGPEPERFDPPIEIVDDWGTHTFRYGPSTSSVWCTPSWDSESNTIYFGTDIHNSPRRPTPGDLRNYTKHSAAVIALDAETGTERWVRQISPGDVWNHSMPPYDRNSGLYKDQSIGDTPKLYSISFEGATRRVVGFGSKNGGFYVLDRSTGDILAHTPIYTDPPTDHPVVDPRTLALPSPIGGLQTGCATDGRRIYTNGIDFLPRLQPLEPNQPTGGRVAAISLDTTSEFWRHERPTIPSIGGSKEEPLFSNVGDPIASGIAVANGVLYCTTASSNQLLAIDASTGELLKEIALGPVFAGPSVSRGRVYVGTGNTLFSPGEQEAYFPKQYTGQLRVFGLPRATSTGAAR